MATEGDYKWGMFELSNLLKEMASAMRAKELEWNKSRLKLENDRMKHDLKALYMTINLLVSSDKEERDLGFVAARRIMDKVTSVTQQGATK